MKDNPFRTFIPFREKAFYNFFWIAEHFLGKKYAHKVFGASKKKNQERILGALRRQSGGARKLIPVDRCKNLSREDFICHYVKKGLPVVFEGAANDWACVKEWSPEYFAKNFGSYETTLVTRTDDHRSFATRDSTLARIYDSMLTGKNEYANFNPILQEKAELRNLLDMDWLFRYRTRPYVDTNYQFFMGGKGTGSDLHCAIICNLFVQVYGEKRWVLYPPSISAALMPEVDRAPCFHTRMDTRDPEKYPALQYLDAHEIVLKPGDILYNPPFYWHQVSNQTDSIGVAFKWSSLPAILRSSWTKAFLTMVATNPPVFMTLSSTGSFTRLFSSRQPKT